MSRFIIAIDQGTTGSTVVLLSEQGRVLGKASQEFPQHFPEPGWVEHEVDDIWGSVLSAMQTVLAQTGVDTANCSAIGITNQRETTVLFEREGGRPVHRAIVWQDRRTHKTCDDLKKQGLEPMFRERTGLVLDPYFSGTKLAYLLDHVPGARQRAETGELAFGTIDTVLVHRLTGGAVHVTDATNASRTLMYNIHTGTWDDRLLETLSIPRSILPEVRSSSEVYGHTHAVPGLPDGIPIAGMAGDQQAALFGQTCFSSGDAKCTYGTGAFLLMNTGSEPKVSEHGLLTTVAWKIGDQTVYALEGSAFVAGSAVQWLRDGLGLIQASEDVEGLAASVGSSDGVVFVPALTGLGAPHWDPHARGSLTGLSRGTTAAHIARATLEGISFQIVDLADAMAKDAGSPLARLRVDGGACRNNLMMQFQSDVLDVAIDRPGCVETTALGAAYLAGMAVGIFEDLEGIRQIHNIERTFEPDMSRDSRQAHMGRWYRAVSQTLRPGMK